MISIIRKDGRTPPSVAINLTLSVITQIPNEGFKLFFKNPAIRLRRCVYNDDGDETGAAKERNAAHSAGGK
jgi:hypothetical protein